MNTHIYIYIYIHIYTCIYCRERVVDGCNPASDDTSQAITIREQVLQEACCENYPGSRFLYFKNKSAAGILVHPSMTIKQIENHTCFSTGCTNL